MSVLGLVRQQLNAYLNEEGYFPLLWAVTPGVWEGMTQELRAIHGVMSGHEPLPFVTLHISGVFIVCLGPKP